MAHANVTASVIISFAGELEDNSSRFYETLAEQFAERKEIFRDFAKECDKNKTAVIRTYQETISDVLEAGFSFEGLDLRDYQIEMTLAEDTSFSEALSMAIKLEENAGEFYLDVAERSESLLATIPRAFSRVAKRRSNRKLKLETLLDESNG